MNKAKERVSFSFINALKIGGLQSIVTLLVKTLSFKPTRAAEIPQALDQLQAPQAASKGHVEQSLLGGGGMGSKPGLPGEGDYIPRPVKEPCPANNNNKHLIEDLMAKVFQHLVASLEWTKIASAACVSKRWNQGVKDPRIQEALDRQFAFGKADWEKYFGEIGDVPALPKDIVEILKSHCPFHEGKRVKDTHMLVLIPETVGGTPLTLNRLQELIQRPQGGGHPTKYSYYSEEAQREFGDQSAGSSYWALMTKDVLSKSRSKSYAEQQALLKGAYKVPVALEIATGILMHHVRTGERLYSYSPSRTYTRCQETLSDGYRVLVGSFGSSGLDVSIDFDYDYYRRDFGGLGALRKFF